MKRTITFLVPALTAVMIYCLPVSASGQNTHVYQYETIQGNRIAWSCEGDSSQGEPTIALIAGGGLDAHTSFNRIYHTWDGPGQICLYERAGMGESTFTDPRTRSFEELVDELHEIDTLASWGKLILVAHSFGGFIARGYASEYPDDVLGLLLLDVTQEDWIPSLQQVMSPDDWTIMDRILAWNTETFHEDYFDAQEAVKWTKIKANLPVTIISRGIPHTQIRLEKMSYEGVRQFNQLHDATQLSLLTLSNNTEHRIAEVSSHMIDNYDPWLVQEEIRELLKRIEPQEYGL